MQSLSAPTSPPSTVLGQHLIAEYYGCAPGVLDDLEALKEMMLAAAQKAGATPVKAEFHRFMPQGVSGVVIIAESHLTIHTWPEYAYAAIDFFTCGHSTYPMRAHEFLSQALGSSHSHLLTLARGIFDGEKGASGTEASGSARDYGPGKT
jgi:S-adenosylmethionine decarboxylase